jgi:hypothetical protein
MADVSTRDKALAGRIRAGGSDTHDLAGYSGAQLESLLPAAFGAPIEAPEMLRVTFVVGGGKKVRGAYGAASDGLTREVCQTLEKLGFSEDRGASCVLECQGTFKYQHDTDKARVGAMRARARDADAHLLRRVGWRLALRLCAMARRGRGARDAWARAPRA